MCVNIEIVLPTIEKFLLLYSLRCGSIVILIWTIIRTLFCVIFFSMTILELLIHKSSPFGTWFSIASYQVPESLTLLLFYCYTILLISDTTLLVFTSFLAYGIYLEKSNLIKYYLICRFLTWVVEVLLIYILCLKHRHLIGYYLSILLFVDMGFDLPKLSRCCCCFSLRTGSLIIGYASLLGATLSLSAVSFSLYKVVTFVNTNATSPEDNHSPDETAHVALGLYISHAYSLLIFLYYFVISLLLVIGVHKNKANLMRYYYFTGLFLIMLALVLAVSATVFLHFIATIGILKWCVILFYCVLVVRSTYLEIEEQNKPRVYEMQSLYTTQQAPLFA